MFQSRVRRALIIGEVLVGEDSTNFADIIEHLLF